MYNYIELGEIMQLCDRKFMCVLSKVKCTCDGCVFEEYSEDFCGDKGIVCSFNCRKDNNDVIFMEVK